MCLLKAGRGTCQIKTLSVWWEMPEKVGRLTGAPPLKTRAQETQVLLSLCNQMTGSHFPAPEKKGFYFQLYLRG